MSRKSRRLYDDFEEGTPFEAPSKHKPHDVKTYVLITCPHCNEAIAQLVQEHVASNKAGKCKAHLAVCPQYTPPMALAPADESKRRHEELMEELRQVRGELTDVKGELTDVQRQLSDKRQCLTDVREWGQLKEPDNTLVPQLTFREANMVAAHNAEVAQVKAEAARQKAEHDAENARLRAELEVLRTAAKEKAPAALLKRAAEAEASVVRMKQELAADVETARADKLYWQDEILKIGAERDQMRRDRRRMQAALHPDKVPEGVREWATKAYQSVFN